MKINYKQISVAILAAVILTASAFAKVPRRIVVEDNTGAWCGWCVRGNYAIEEMLLQYQDRFIAVGEHNQDHMATALQGTIGQQFGLQGFPSGLINRRTDLGQSGYFIDPDNWSSIVATHINDSSSVDVGVTYSVDSVAKTLTATVTATMTDDYNGQLAFNLYVMEDNVTGSGEGWDQHNYLPNYSQYKGINPYYYEPQVIPHYVHQNVLRAMGGDALGMNGSFPSTAVAGQTYTQDFTIDISSLKIQNFSNIWVVGVVQKTGSQYEIMNAKEAGKTYLKQEFKAYPVSYDVYNSALRNNSTTASVEFQNLSNRELTVGIVLDNEESNLPSDWSASIEQESFTIPANSKKSINIDILLGASKGYAQIALKAKTVDGTDFYGGSAYSSVNVLSDGFDYGLFEYGDGRLDPITESINNLPEIKSKIVSIPISNGSLSAFSNYPFKLLIVPETFGSYGAMINNTPMITMVNNYINAGKGVLLTSILDMFFTAGNSSQLVPNQATLNLFNTTFGISGYSGSLYFLGNPNAQQIWPVGVKGNDDQISKGFDFQINQYNSATFPNYTYYADQIKILNPTIASPILLYSADSLTSNSKNIAAVKIQTATNRNIYMGFSFDLIMDATVRTTLFNNMMTWLLGTNDVKDLGSMNSANMAVYPNPVSANANVTLTSTENAQADIYLVDMSGSRVAGVYNGILNGGGQNLNFTTAGLPSGKYYMISNLNGVMSQTPVVVAK